MNENMRIGKLQCQLSTLRLIKILSQFSNLPLEASLISGSAQIDAVWTTPNLIPSKFSILPHYFGIRDHRIIIADLQIEYFIGKGFIPIAK